ncbi:MAG: PQQ-like beta-propeller repeat protein [Planctomycetes bacterium]|nr:PQQ-like beta-propeller repeat protein [Planctomycetota bacterium]
MIARWTYALLALALIGSLTHADDWPQWLGPKRDGVWRETGILAKFPQGGLKVRWRTPIGEGYSGPAVVNGKVYVTDRVRAKGAKNPDNSFDSKTRVAGVERVLCLNEPDGKVIWKKEYPRTYQISYASGPRTTPLVAGGKVYTLGAMGDLYCFDANTGKILWSKDLVKEYKTLAPKWGFSGHPLLDGDRLICLVGGEGSVAVAFNKDTGAEIWKALSSFETGYAPPMIYEIGGKRQLILWHPESINSLDPETGKVHWSQRYNRKKQLGAGMSIPTPRLDGDLLFFTCFYDGSLMLKTKGLAKPSVLWQKAGRSVMPEDTDGLHSVMVTPVIKNGYIYGVDSYGELRCLKESTGERIWSTHKPVTGESTRWGNAFIVEQGNRYFLLNELGDLILARFSPKGYEEISRANIIAPTNGMAPPAGRLVLWSHPAFANRSVYARNDREIVCVSLAQ